MKCNYINNSKNLKFISELAKGSSGNTYKYQCLNSRKLVCLKRCADLNLLLYENDVLSKFSHKNL